MCCKLLLPEAPFGDAGPRQVEDLLVGTGEAIVESAAYAGGGAEDCTTP